MRPVAESKIVSSRVAIPMPMTTPPMIWLRAVFSLSTLPASIAETTRAIRGTKVLVDPHFDEVRGERRRCTLAAAGVEVRPAVGGDLIQIMASQYLGIALARRGVLDQMHATIGAADLGRTSPAQR